MEVKLLDRNNGIRSYKVTHKNRWWKVTHHVISGNWRIENESGKPLDPYGKVGLRAQTACEKFAETELDDEYGRTATVAE